MEAAHERCSQISDVDPCLIPLDTGSRWPMSVIVIIESMWGAIEWILPVCKYLKDNYSGLQFIFILSRYNSKDIFRENTFLEELVNEVTDKRCYDLSYFFPRWSKFVLKYLGKFRNKPRSLGYKFLFRWEKFSWRYLSGCSMRKWIYELRPFVILKDNFWGILKNFDIFSEAAKENGCKVICFPTAPSFGYSPDIWEDIWEKRSFRDNELKDTRVGFYPADLFIVDNTWDADYFRLCGKESVVVGTPKFDEFWIKYLETRCESGEKQKETSDHNMLVLLKNDKSVIFEYVGFENLLKEIIETALLFEKYKLILKPHPRQDLDLLNRIVRRYNSSRVLISHQPSFGLIRKSEILIAMPSGAIFDALIMGRPVIEYFPLKTLNGILRNKFKTIPKNYLGGMSYIDEDGDATSIWRAKGLVAPADNPEELRIWLEKFRNGEPWEGTVEIREVFSNVSIKKAAETIMAMGGRNIIGRLR